MNESDYYVCEFCGYSTDKISNMKRHMNRKTPCTMGSSSTSKVKYTCNVCKFTTTCKDTFDNHSQEKCTILLEQYSIEMNKNSESSSRGITDSVKRHILFHQDYKCAHCKTTLPPTHQFDHIIPYSISKNNSIINIQALCPNCHAVKTQRERMLKVY